MKARFSQENSRLRSAGHGETLFALLIVAIGIGFVQPLQSRGEVKQLEGPERTSIDESVEELVPVKDPPPVQMLVPGFSVRELPVELTNINNLRYRPDGKLYALGYNGDVWLLSDADGDGLEESKSRFFENKGNLRGPIGMAVIPPGHALLAKSPSPGSASNSQGIVVASKGKISALFDLDGDEVAEQERIIASGWEEIPTNVDAIGLAIHPDDGAIYFGLGTAAYNNAYLLDKSGKSEFDLKSERGTIQRIEPDLSRRSIVCTGVRFTIGMAFNGDKQLFATDQEGATWLPNGNPFDELLHIRPGLHYGFPPRHPRHLPNVFDQPSLFDYGPQHQSTCGMAFNEPFASGGPTFGPEAWRGDLFVCGESRGKLYRTRLVKTESGQFVASNQLIGCLSMLTVDCCVTPRGALLIACHSGGPDWGTGPTGIGKIFLVQYTDPKLPQPIRIWPTGPQEVRVVFDRPLDPQHLKGIREQTNITHGEFVAAGDRFESIRPGYAVTKMQQSTLRRKLAVYSINVTADRRTLILATAAQHAAEQYALTLPGLGRETSKQNNGEFPQLPQLDLAYSLCGIQADWQPHDSAQVGWSGWLPHLDFRIAAKLFKHDTDLNQFQQIFERPGSLKTTFQIDTRGLFLPNLQPGSKLDFELNEDNWVRRASIEFESLTPFSVLDLRTNVEQISSISNEKNHVSITVSKDATETLRISVRSVTGPQNSAVSALWKTTLADGSTHSGPLPLHRFLLPWADTDFLQSEIRLERSIPELAGGSWGRGRRVFLSDEAACSKCHAAQMTVGQIGPDLSNLIHRDYASVLRDITQPSFSINPDFITYNALLKDGRVLSGAIRSDGDQLLFGDKDGRVTMVARTEIEELRPSAVSLMPDEVIQKLGPEKTKDLLTYLLREPPHMPRDAKLTPPPPRKRSEVAMVLAGSDSATDPTVTQNPVTQNRTGNPVKPLKILLVAGNKDHGAGEHDYPAWLQAWSELLEAAPAVTIDSAMDWPTQEQLQAANTIVFFQKGSWTSQRAHAIDHHLARGGGLVYIHWAIEAAQRAPEFAQRIGLASNAAETKYRHGPLELSFQPGAHHPIARNFDRANFYDESYWQLHGDASKIRVLASGIEQGEPRPLFWTVEPAQGRVFVSILGHYSWTFDDPLFRILLLRGIAWSANQSVDRFNDLVLPGATISD